MIKSLQLYILTTLMLVVSSVVMGQNDGVPQPTESALDLAFQKPQRWAGYDYDHSTTFWERSYAMAGIGTDGIWGMSDLLGGSTNGFYGAVSFGHWVAPVYGYEVGFNGGLLPILDWEKSRLGTNYSQDSYTQYFNIAVSGVMSITSYAQKLQHPSRWEVIAKAGVDLRIQDIVALGLHTSMRCQYNVTPEIGLYIEPQAGVYTNALDNEKITPTYSTHILPSISAGLTVRLERSEGYRKQGYTTSAERVRAYVQKHGVEDRSMVQKIIGPRLNDDILADTLALVEEVMIEAESVEADSSSLVIVVPSDSAGLAQYRADSLERAIAIRADSVRKAVMLKDSLTQIAIMRKDPVGRATLEADSLRRLEAARADSVLRAEAARAEAARLLQEELERNHTFHCGKVAISTNALYWAAAMPNIGFEIPIKSNYSVAFSYLCPWFSNYLSGFSYRLLNWDLEGRYWFDGTHKLRGLYVGAFGSLGYYDFMKGGIGWMGDILRSVGVSAGYSLPLGHTVSLNMSVGAGLISTVYSNYHEDDGYLVYDSKHSISMVGPVKATASIVWSPEFDFKNTAMFNSVVREEQREIRAIRQQARDAVRARAEAKAIFAKEQKARWIQECKDAKAQMKVAKARKRETDKEEAARAKETKAAEKVAAAESAAAEKAEAKAAKAAEKAEDKATEKATEKSGKKSAEKANAESTTEPIVETSNSVSEIGGLAAFEEEIYDDDIFLF